MLRIFTQTYPIMTKKLTLSMDEKVIERAKRISARRGKSVSKILEEFIKSIPDKEEEKEEFFLDKIHRIILPHKNKIRMPENGDYKTMIGDWRYEDYINSHKKKK